MTSPSTSNWSSIKRFSIPSSKSKSKSKSEKSPATPTPPPSIGDSSEPPDSNPDRPAKVQKTAARRQSLGSEEIIVPDVQTILLLRAARKPYEVVEGWGVPGVERAEDVLVRNGVIGLNPIDWKAPDFNFAIPTLPYISGREAAGTVVKTKDPNSRFKPHDRVLVISTDYRDLRKATYQQYILAPSFNLAKIPPTIPLTAASTLGVAFVAAALALGVCFGVDFSAIHGGPDLRAILRGVSESAIPADVRAEVLRGVDEGERGKKDDWLVIWGASATSANVTFQLARIAGLRTVGVLDMAKHGVRVSGHGVLRPDLWVDGHDPERAVEVIKKNTKGKARFALDTIGKGTAGWAAQAVSEDCTAKTELTPPVTPAAESAPEKLKSHVVGLSGVPKEQGVEGVQFHSVPIKLFHEVPEVGRALTGWLERLLGAGDLVGVDILEVEKGLGRVNAGLDRMRRGEISGGKLVVEVE